MVAKNDMVVELANEEFSELINNSHKVVAVDFFAEWCMPCVMLEPVIEDLAEEMKEVKFVKVNVDDNGALARENKVSTIPCLIIFKEGQEVDRIRGVQPRALIREKIGKYL